MTVKDLITKINSLPSNTLLVVDETLWSVHKFKTHMDWLQSIQSKALDLNDDAAKRFGQVGIVEWIVK